MTLPRSSKQALSGWGRYPVEDCVVYRPDRDREIAALVAEAPERSIAPRGRGRSYGDAAIHSAGAVIASDRVDRMLAFDPENGVLHCEAGVTLSSIIDTFLPRGFFFPVTPGTKEISVGGAIAADVHGKNHHSDGSLGDHLVELSLLIASGEVLRCARDENPEVFWATIGGLGLTGVILDARIRLKPVASAYLMTQTEKTRNLEDTLQRMAERDTEFEYSVAWIDCLASGANVGRSVLMRANPAAPDALPSNLRSDPLALRKRWRPAIPFDFPSMTLNPLSMKLFNAGFYAAHSDGESIEDYDGYFYPLDTVPKWNRIYGKRGVLQYQVLIPMGLAASVLAELLESISRSRGGSFLAVLKSMGPANQAPLSFPDSGMTLSLDFPNVGPGLITHLNQLDDLVLEAGGRVYLAKDCCLRPGLVEQMYPRFSEFLAVKEAVDPDRRFDSSLAQRLRFWGGNE